MSKMRLFEDAVSKEANPRHLRSLSTSIGCYAWAIETGLEPRGCLELEICDCIWIQEFRELKYCLLYNSRLTASACKLFVQDVQRFSSHFSIR